MNIGIDARGAIWYRGTGIGTYTYQLIYQLKQREDGACYRPFWPGEEYRELDITDEKEFNNVEIGNEYWEQFFLPRALTREHFDLYHVPQNGIGLPKTKKCPQVVTIHDLIPYIYPETVGKGYLKTFFTEMPRIMEESDRIITVSHWSKKDITQIFAYPAEKIDVIWEAPEPVYRPLEKSLCRKLLGEKYRLEEDYILYVGGFSPRKNIKLLLTAFAKISKEIEKPIYLVLPGKKQKEPDYLDALIAALGISDRVLFPGFVPVGDLPYFYAGAELFVYPSYYEGFGLPPLEAMACGTPTLAARASSLPEVLERGAAWFDPYNYMELAESLFFFLTHPEASKNLGANGYHQAQKFSWAKTAQETVKTYQKTISGC
ncbi:glycosyltransferase family 4 protein [Dehalobacterium formicoaceticum]|uniref:glycosyltransferase family 4 protein n=1 Tax=Dehalobacterium formicoaceticum TaxID=51515 RepID=UPI000B7FB651|nr:glycosyltransferase family 1 protein [Dehalobacterium formicoaceticum]